MTVGKGPSSRVILRSGQSPSSSGKEPSFSSTLSMGNMSEIREQLGMPVDKPKGLNTSIVQIESPLTLSFRRDNDAYYSSVYRLATYYFVNCSILSSTILRIKDETLRRGLEWTPLFESECPKCGERHQHATSRCVICGFEGVFKTPDVSQKKLFTNWEGGSMMDKCNKYGWNLVDLCDWWIVASQVYNQPICLCKSTYYCTKGEDILDEVVEEFVPIPSANAKMLFDDRGSPGDGTGFRITDRNRKYDMRTGVIASTGRDEDGNHIYPARWEIMPEGGNAGGGTLYSDKEIYHKTFGVTSVNYGTPRCMFISANIKAWIAFETRIEKYLSTGHPQGIFIINGISVNAFQTLRKDIEIQMRGDPYGIPMIAIPPIQDKVTNAKWIPFMDEPTKGLIDLKQELLERIVSAFGSTQLMSNDTDAFKGSTNQETQFSVIDRTLDSVRKHTNAFLKWCVSKFEGITDWTIRVTEPSDDVRRDELDEENMKLVNAQLYKNLGFEIISQNDGEIEISRTPQSFDPLTRLLDPSMVEDGDGTNEDLPSKTEEPEDMLDFSTKSATKAVDAEMLGRAFAEAIKRGVVFK